LNDRYRRNPSFDRLRTNGWTEKMPFVVSLSNHIYRLITIAGQTDEL
tara:strand:- start:182 stop:322 length:141 start_codon:yes stop_codon:yes gene_type:complete